MEQLGYRIERRDGDVHVGITGVLDLASRPVFADLVDEVLAEASGAVVIDLSGLEFLDSTGIVELIRAARQAEDAGVDIRFVGPASGAARRTAEVVDLDHLLGTRPPHVRGDAPDEPERHLGRED